MGKEEEERKLKKSSQEEVKAEFASEFELRQNLAASLLCACMNTTKPPLITWAPTYTNTDAH
jgi:hypothetical protein